MCVCLCVRVCGVLLVSVYLLLSSLAQRRAVWCVMTDLFTSSLHSCRLCDMACVFAKPVHSTILSAHFFFCPPILRFPSMVPRSITLASITVTWPCHFSLIVLHFPGDRYIARFCLQSLHKMWSAVAQR